ncbi:MAG: hypothetical protein SLAVMIC_01034 [uncultured marine phage]|uniref:Uncharacterized protein n=1 Tax=uncultured marine phage TaxID=707152 RepID=A0A8D9FS14_9VIRU|nr:MAG: hypothetical protein SLAVMIC_01034 [uncultured marine phage]
MSEVFKTYFKLKKSERLEYNIWCVDNLGVPDLYRNNSRELVAHVPLQSNPKVDDSLEPIYNTISFNFIYPAFKSHMREKRLKKLLS